MLRAHLVSDRAEQWPWCSLWHRLKVPQQDSLLSGWPVPYPGNWVENVDEPQTEAELQALRLSVKRNRPFGDEAWVEATAERLRLGQHCGHKAGHQKEKKERNKC